MSRKAEKRASASASRIARVSRAKLGSLLMMLIFTTVGALMLWWSASSLVEWRDALGWTKTQAYFVALKFDRTVHNNKRNEVDYFLEVRYAYSFDGKGYESTRVAPSFSAAYLPSPWVYDELKSYQEQDRPLYCFVNPARPELAVLYRDLDWVRLLGPALIGLLFAGLGMMGPLIALYELLRGKPSERSNPKLPRKPPAWAGGRILPLNRSSLQFRKLGDLALALEHVPVILGNELRGRIEPPPGSRISGAIRLKLQCIRHGVDDAGAARAQQRLWETEQLIAVPDSAEASSAGIAFCVAIPSALPAEQGGSLGGRLQWQLETRFEWLGQGVSAYFDLPIFSSETLPP